MSVRAWKRPGVSQLESVATSASPCDVTQEPQSDRKPRILKEIHGVGLARNPHRLPLSLLRRL